MGWLSIWMYETSNQIKKEERIGTRPNLSSFYSVGETISLPR